MCKSDAAWAVSTVPAVAVERPGVNVCSVMGFDFNTDLVVRCTFTVNSIVCILSVVHALVVDTFLSLLNIQNLNSDNDYRRQQRAL